jgi:hypothetical protein
MSKLETPPSTTPIKRIPGIEPQKGVRNLMAQVNEEPVRKLPHPKSMGSSSSESNLSKNIESLKNDIKTVKYQEYVKCAYELNANDLAQMVLELEDADINKATDIAKDRFLSATSNVSLSEAEKNKDKPLIDLFDQFLLEAKETIVLKESGKFIGGPTQESERVLSKIDSKISKDFTIGVELQTIHDNKVALSGLLDGFVDKSDNPEFAKETQPGVAKANKINELITKLSKNPEGQRALSELHLKTLDAIDEKKPLTLNINEEGDLEMNPDIDFSQFGLGGFNHNKAHAKIMNNRPLNVREDFLNTQSDKFNLTKMGYALMANAEEKGAPLFDKDGKLDPIAMLDQFLKLKDDEKNSMGLVHLFVCDTSTSASAVNLIVARLEAGMKGEEALEEFDAKQEEIKTATIKFFNEVIIPAFEDIGLTLEISHYGPHGTDVSLYSTHIHAVVKIAAVDLGKLNEKRKENGPPKLTQLTQLASKDMLIPSKAMIANDYKTPLYVSDQKHADSIVPEHGQ